MPAVVPGGRPEGREHRGTARRGEILTAACLSTLSKCRAASSARAVVVGSGPDLSNIAPLRAGGQLLDQPEVVEHDLRAVEIAQAVSAQPSCPTRAPCGVEATTCPLARGDASGGGAASPFRQPAAASSGSSRGRSRGCRARNTPASAAASSIVRGSLAGSGLSARSPRMTTASACSRRLSSSPRSLWESTKFKCRSFSHAKRIWSP